MIDYDKRIDEIIAQLEAAKERHSMEVDLSIASNLLDELLLYLGG